MPDDLKTLVGTGVTAAVSADGLTGGSPKFVVQSRTDGAAAAQVLDHVRQAFEQPGAPGLPVPVPGQLERPDLRQRPGLPGRRSGRPAARSCPAWRRSGSPSQDRAGAQYSAFVNLDAIAASMRTGGASQDDLQAISAFSAAGLTVRISGNTADLHVRLLAH